MMVCVLLWLKHLGNLSGIKFPLYCFGSLPAKGNDDSYGGTSCTVDEEQGLLDCLLLSQVYMVVFHVLYNPLSSH